MEVNGEHGPTTTIIDPAKVSAVLFDGHLPEPR